MKSMGLSNSFRGSLTKLILPIAFQQFMLTLVNASDALMLGQLSQNALSAVSLATQVTFVYNLFLAAMTIGTSMFAAQYWGNKDITSVEKIFAYVLKISFCVSLVFSFFSFIMPEAIMGLLTNDTALQTQGAIYLKMVSVTYVIMGISQITLCIFKNSEKAFKSSLISSVCVVLNIVLNAILIFGLFGFPKLEIAGAALATVISRVIELIWCFWEMGKKGSVKCRFVYVRKCDTQLKRDFWKYTSPVLGNEIVWGVGFTMTAVIMGHLGSDAVAANSIANIIKNLVACFCIGLGNGGGIMIGNDLGAKNFEQAKENGKLLCKIAIALGIVSGLFLVAVTPLVLRITNLSEQANSYLIGMMLMCSYYMIGKSVNCTTIGGIFCAGGDSKFGFLCDTVTLWCVTVPLGFIAAFWLKLPVLWVYFILSLDEMLKLPFVYRRYKKYKWIKDLTVKEDCI